ncbi:MAG: helix-turn-helix domain-containing protein [Verrucomicrobiota bacterium]
MKTLGHLLIEPVTLQPGQEWMDAAAAWHFVRVAHGAAYWLGTDRTRSLNEGEMLVIAPGARGQLRASQIGEVLLHAFNFMPELLYGFFTLAERHLFETGMGTLLKDIQFLPSTHPLARQFAGLASSTLKPNSLALRIEVLSLVAGVFDEEMSGHRAPESLGTSALRRFQQLIAQMPDTELIHHPPEHLARLCGCSPRHFNRLFRSHFGVSARERQTELRLQKASQVLADTDAKIIQVALECGYRNLSLFNSLFKRRFGLTPSEWRRRNSRRTGRALSVLAGLLAVFGAAAARAQDVGPPRLYLGTPVSSEALGQAQEALDQQMEQMNFEAARAKLFPIPRTNAAPAAASGPKFEVKGYEIEGNTLLSLETLELIVRPYTGSAVGFPVIRQALADLQLAYRDRGFVTVGVALPQQQLTNGYVKVVVTEGRLSEINVLKNFWFTSNNVMRALPGIETNIILNGLEFQQELDRANQNRDRQIYPTIRPGPEPGQSVLDLTVKDRLPLHGRMELNNYNTPHSPALRLTAAIQYNNLWQLEHQIGGQYTFTPQEMKEGSFPFYNQPLIASYSAFYRMPLAGPNGSPDPFKFTPYRLGANEEYNMSAFGYDEATHRFKPPPASGAPEFLFYGSGSSSDTGVGLQSQSLTPPVIPPEGTLQVSDQTFSRTLNPTEDIGMRYNQPLLQADRFDSSFTAGFDYKKYQSTTAQTRVFQATLYIPQYGSTGPPFTTFQSPPTLQSRTIASELTYLPFTVGTSATRGDPWGSFSVDGSFSFQFANLLSTPEEFEAVTLKTNSTGTYLIFNGGITRDQKLYGDWLVRARLAGQAATQPLVSTEQFPIGGQTSVRGYHEGELYGDSGWHVQVELRTPYFNSASLNHDPSGPAPDVVPTLVQGYAFYDFGAAFLQGGAGNADPNDPSGAVPQPARSLLAGAGVGMTVSVGSHVDFRLQVAVPLRSTYPAAPYGKPDVSAGDVRVTFSLGAQF